MFPEQPGLNNSLCSTMLMFCNPLGSNVYLPKDKHVSLKQEIGKIKITTYTMCEIYITSYFLMQHLLQ